MVDEKDGIFGDYLQKGERQRDMILAYRYQDEKERVFEKGCKKRRRVT